MFIIQPSAVHARLSFGAGASLAGHGTNSDPFYTASAWAAFRLRQGFHGVPLTLIWPCSDTVGVTCVGLPVFM